MRVYAIITAFIALSQVSLSFTSLVERNNNVPNYENGGKVRRTLENKIHTGDKMSPFRDARRTNSFPEIRPGYRMNLRDDANLANGKRWFNATRKRNEETIRPDLTFRDDYKLAQMRRDMMMQENARRYMRIMRLREEDEDRFRMAHQNGLGNFRDNQFQPEPFMRMNPPEDPLMFGNPIPYPPAANQRQFVNNDNELIERLTKIVATANQGANNNSSRSSIYNITSAKPTETRQNKPDELDLLDRMKLAGRRNQEEFTSYNELDDTRETRQKFQYGIDAFTDEKFEPTERIDSTQNTIFKRNVTNGDPMVRYVSKHGFIPRQRRKEESPFFQPKTRNKPDGSPLIANERRLANRPDIMLRRRALEELLRYEQHLNSTANVDNNRREIPQVKAWRLKDRQEEVLEQDQPNNNDTEVEKLAKKMVEFTTKLHENVAKEMQARQKLSAYVEKDCNKDKLSTQTDTTLSDQREPNRRVSKHKLEEVTPKVATSDEYNTQNSQVQGERQRGEIEPKSVDEPPSQFEGLKFDNYMRQMSDCIAARMGENQMRKTTSELDEETNMGNAGEEQFQVKISRDTFGPSAVVVSPSSTDNGNVFTVDSRSPDQVIMKTTMTLKNVGTAVRWMRTDVPNSSSKFETETDHGTALVKYDYMEFEAPFTIAKTVTVRVMNSTSKHGYLEKFSQWNPKETVTFSPQFRTYLHESILSSMTSDLHVSLQAAAQACTEKCTFEADRP